MVSTDNDISGEIYGGEAALLVAGEDLLSRDNIPDKNQQLTCFSCGTRYVGIFCHACGQKNDDLRRSLFGLLLEMLGNLTAFDSRIWRTWAKLLTRPGRVAREFADGSRTKWTSPVRAYLAMSILLFGYIALTGTQIVSLTMDVERAESAPASLSELKPSQLNTEIKIHMFETTRSLERMRADSNTELVDFLLNYPEPLKFDYDNGSVKLVEKTYIRPSRSDELPETETLESTRAEAVESPASDLPDMDGMGDKPLDTASAEDGFMTINGERISSDEASGRVVGTLKTLLARPQILNSYFSTYLPRVMFFMMPFTMFIGIIFIRGRGNALLYDHLVHAAYIHAVFFFLLLLGLILGQHTPIPPLWLMGLLTLYMFLYLPMSLGAMFKRGPIKTIWSSYAIGLNYFLTMFFIILFLITYAFSNVMEQIGFGSIF